MQRERRRGREREREQEREERRGDMQVVVDLDNQYHFPTSLTYTSLRPDLAVYSELTKTAILVEQRYRCQ